MKKNFKYRFITLICFICLLHAAANTAHAQTFKKTSELYYTYLGLIVSGGINSITYNDWINNSEGSEDISGSYLSGGFLFNIYIKNIAGDFRLQYHYNMNDNETLQHLYLAIAGRYVYKINTKISLSSGPGLYFDSPPSTGGYDGSPGFWLPLGMVLNLGFDTKLVFDIIGKYGSYGKGEDSTKLSYGASVGIMYKVGRL
jgi:hypothetical protein